MEPGNARSTTNERRSLWPSWRQTPGTPHATNFVYPERRKVPQVYEQNADEARRALAALDGHLEGRDWLVGAPVLYVSDLKTDQYFATGGARKSNL